ncbi:hypothetical protein C8Q76DRAFT_706344 [Earliella scabrosa]|nr:hypothetical protein C8Q76DRAFT_706344 [Earliella scabrosa]
MTRQPTTSTVAARKRRTPARSPSSSALESPPLAPCLAEARCTKSSRFCFPKEAYVMLREFYDNVTPTPSTSQRSTLLKKIVKMPGCKQYTAHQLRIYFKTRRKEQRRAERAVEQTQQELNTRMPLVVGRSRSSKGTAVKRPRLTRTRTKKPVIPEPHVYPAGSSEPDQVLAPFGASLAATSSNVSRILLSPFSPSAASVDELPSSFDNVSESSITISHFASSIADTLRDVFTETALELELASCPKTYSELSRWLEVQNSGSVAFLDNIAAGAYVHVGLGPDSLQCGSEREREPH